MRCFDVLSIVIMEVGNGHIVDHGPWTMDQGSGSDEKSSRTFWIVLGNYSHDGNEEV